MIRAGPLVKNDLGFPIGLNLDVLQFTEAPRHPQSSLLDLQSFPVHSPCLRVSVVACPLTPSPSPALGRGEPKSIEFLEKQRVSSLYSAILNKVCNRRGDDAGCLGPVGLTSAASKGLIPSIVEEKLHQIKQRPL